MLNVLDISEEGLGALLGCNVPSYREACYWLDYYRHWYSHTRGVFVIARQCENTGLYFVIQ